MTSDRGYRRRGQGQAPSAGFTVIELLVVISIISLLAGLVVGGAALAKRAGRESRLRTEMHQFITAIESYKEAIGQYPPDNPVKPWCNTLFYELSGVVVSVNASGQGEFRLKGQSEPILSDNLKTLFGVAGIANAATDPREVRKFMDFKASQHKVISDPMNLEVLVAPVPWPTGPIATTYPPRFTDAATKTLNPWHYLATPNATNNTTSFDLWVEFIDGKQKKMICNWSEDVLVISP